MDVTAIPTVNARDIETALHELGITRGDIVMVHSSLSRFGFVEGGAPAVVQAVTQAVGSEGTAIFPTFTFTLRDQECPVFDLRDTLSEVGLITEVARKVPGAFRTSHFLHSVCVLGNPRRFAELPCYTSWGADTPFMELVRLKGWVLLFGVSYSSCTLLHAAEQAVNVSYRYERRMIGTLIDVHGQAKPHACSTLQRASGYDNDFNRMTERCVAAGVQHTTRVGAATITAVRANHLFSLAVDALQRDMGALLRRD